MPERFLRGITRYRDTDADELRAFQLRMFGEDARQLDRQRFTWLFERNPCRSPEGVGLWVCRREGRIVGQQAEIPFELRVGGRVRPAAWAIDLMVDEAWRIRGVAPGLMATQLAGRSLAGGLNLSDKGKRTYERAGWADLGVVDVYVRPLDVTRALRLAPVSPRLRRLGPAAGVALRAVDAAVGRLARATGLRLIPVPRFDDRIDEVWAASASDYPVLAVRDAATTRWRLDERPDRDDLRRYLLWRKGATLGYVALRRSVTANDAGGDRAAIVVDYLAPARWVAPLLTLAALEARHDGAVALLCKTRNAPADRWLRAAGFVRRASVADEPIRFVFRCDEEVEGPEVARLVTDPDAWFVTSADSDLELAMTPAGDRAAAGAEVDAATGPAAGEAADAEVGG
ncbi:MAG TPA: GNAT family N-acetyltransferase [Acidimicrobiales bacterium]